MLKIVDVYGITLFSLLTIMVGFQEMVAPAIGVTILVVLFEGLIRRKLSFKPNTGLFLWIGLFLLYLLGLLWSEHTEVGWKLLEYKMSFFIFPLLFLFPKKGCAYKEVINGFLAGLLLLTIRLIAEIFFLGNQNSYYDIFREAIGLHPTYVSAYYATGILLILWNIRNSRDWISWAVSLVLILCSVWIIYRNGSFAGILFLGVMLTIGAAYLVLRLTNRWVLIAFILVIPVLLGWALTRADALRYDMEVMAQLRQEIAEGKDAFFEKNKGEVSGNKERVLMWLLSAEIIRENPAGVGTGDIDFHLRDKCEQHGLFWLKEQNLNPHNQFLQIGIDLGYPGILYLTLLMVFLIYQGIKNKNWLLWMVALNLLFNALFESVLQRQSGIVFYTLVISLILVLIDNEPHGRIKETEGSFSNPD